MEASGVVAALLREVEELLPRIVGLDETRRFLALLARINRFLEERSLGRIIVTGGFAVEVYTGRVYRTMDVDVVVEGREACRVFEELLRRLGERVARGYLPRHEALSTKSIDVVSTVYDRRLEPVKLVVDSDWIYLEPPEELIVRYLAAWRFWGSTIDRDKALWLYAATRDMLDEEALRMRAREEGVEHELEEIRSLAAKALGGEG